MNTFAICFLVCIYRKQGHSTILRIKQNSQGSFWSILFPSFNKYLLITYCISGTILGTGNIAMNKTYSLFLCSLSSCNHPWINHSEDWFTPISLALVDLGLGSILIKPHGYNTMLQGTDAGKTIAMFITGPGNIWQWRLKILRSTNTQFYMSWKNTYPELLYMEIIYTLRRMEVISCSCEMCCKSHPQDETSVLPSYYQDVGHLK